MGFDAGKFEQAAFDYRTQEVDATEVKEFFDEGEKAVFKVRGLDSRELFQAESAAMRAGNLTELVKQITGQDGKKAVNAALQILGIKEDMPREYVRALHTVRMGLVDPELAQPQVVKLADTSPALFTRLKTTIDVLSGQGKSPGELSASGTTRKSKRR